MTTKPLYSITVSKQAESYHPYLPMADETGKHEKVVKCLLLHARQMNFLLSFLTCIMIVNASRIAL